MEGVIWGATLLLFSQALYLLVYALAGRLKSEITVETNEDSYFEKTFAVIIPSYKAGSVTKVSVSKILAANYPQNQIDIYVVASGESFPKGLNAPNVHLLEFPNERLIKVAGLREAHQHFKKSYDIVLVLDADNHISPNAFQLASRWVTHSFPVLQIQRKAKNQEFPFAYLDGISESINNHIFRKGHQALGVAPALSGSGMFFTNDHFEKYVLPIQSKIGFDKSLELALLKDCVPIRYTQIAFVLDEKVDDIAVFKTQRLNWLSAQYHHGIKHIGEAIIQFFKGNWNYADKVLQFLMLPRLLLLTGAFIAFCSSWFWIGSSLFWGLQLPFITISLALIVSIGKEYWTPRLFFTLLKLPRLSLIMALNVLKIKKPQDDFQPTPHKIKEKDQLKGQP
ncbi:MAG: glycosyltransferase family 2 protein [Schleiferiaceae bacterium]|nr:glycosyltransferase family 2 protein [Schleiferiaceae bacterium]